MLNIVNIGLGLISIIVAILFISLGLLSHKNDDRIIGSGLLVIGAMVLSISIILLTGIYDPYANHIR